jgi:hypothetical protein
MRKSEPQSHLADGLEHSRPTGAEHSCASPIATFADACPCNPLGEFHTQPGGGKILSVDGTGPDLDSSMDWTRIEDDDKYSGCLYRLTGDGQVEILALGAHVVVPIDALPLLPEPIARSVLAELAKGAAGELRRAVESVRAEEER